MPKGGLSNNLLGKWIVPKPEYGDVTDVNQPNATPSVLVSELERVISELSLECAGAGHAGNVPKKFVSSPKDTPQKIPYFECATFAPQLRPRFKNLRKKERSK